MGGHTPRARLPVAAQVCAKQVKFADGGGGADNSYTRRSSRIPVFPVRCHSADSFVIISKHGFHSNVFLVRSVRRTRFRTQPLPARTRKNTKTKKNDRNENRIEFVLETYTYACVNIAFPIIRVIARTPLINA